MTILHGDCRQLMAAMEDSSVDSIVCDPPYEIGFMGRSWDRSGVAFDATTWAAALRVLKPGGHLVAFGGARTYHRMACAIENAGFDIRDQIMWIYGSGFPKGGVRAGIGTCLKPAHEPIVLARKPCAGSARTSIAAHGTGGLNIDACRTDAIGYSGGGRNNSIAFGSSLPPQPRCDGSLGRWPANIVHDGSDEVLAGFPLSEARDGGHKGDNMGFGAKGAAVRRVPVAARTDTGSAARFFYCAKASKVDREEGCERLPKVKGRANRHNTVKPEGVMRWLVRLATPAGGLVLDPFAGSGSTGKAAVLEGRRFIGCELTAEYVPIAEARIAAARLRVAA